MMRVLQWLISGHVHKWVEDSRHNLSDDEKDIIGKVVYCHREKCGKPRRFALR